MYIPVNGFTVIAVAFAAASMLLVSVSNSDGNIGTDYLGMMYDGGIVQDAHAQTSPLGNFNLASNNSDPAGIAFGDGKFWVVDRADDAVYAYHSDGTPDSDASFQLVSGNNDPTGIAFGDGMIWVVDRADDEVYAYNPDGTNDSASGFLLPSDRTTPTGIAFGDGRLWVADAYSSSCGHSSRINYCAEFLVYTTSGQHISSHGRIGTPVGIAFGNDRLWVVASGSSVSSYTTSGGIDRVSSLRLQSSNDAAVGIAFDNGNLWVVDNDGTVYSYSGAVIPGFDLASRTDPTGIAFGDGRIWVVDTYSSSCGHSSRINHCDEFLVYTTSGRLTYSTHLHSTHNDPVGITFGNGKVWIVDEIDDRIYAYRSAGGYDSSSGFALDPENDAPAGLTFGDGKFWVVDHADDAVYAYAINGTPDSDASFQLVSGNNDPTGIAFGDGMIWVVDNADEAVYAYDSDGTYDSDSGFGLYIGIGLPTGITFGDGKFWVVDSNNTVRIYPAGQLPPVQLPGSGQDSSLDPRVTSLETMMADMKTMISSLEGMVADLTTRITALETGTPTPAPNTPLSLIHISEPTRPY